MVSVLQRYADDAPAAAIPPSQHAVDRYCLRLARSRRAPMILNSGRLLPIVVSATTETPAAVSFLPYAFSRWTRLRGWRGIESYFILLREPFDDMSFASADAIRHDILLTSCVAACLARGEIAAKTGMSFLRA